MYSRQLPHKHPSITFTSRKNRNDCFRHVISIQGVFCVVFFTFVCLGYWIGQTMTLGSEVPRLVEPGKVKKGQRTTPVRTEMEPDEFKPLNELNVDDVIDSTFVASLNSSRSVFYVICGNQNAIEYVQYLSLASVTRFFDPTHLVFLYETDPPTLVPGTWTTTTRLDDLLRKCPARLVTLKMRSAHRVCHDTIKMEEFVMKLLFQFGGLYVGRRTFMTEMATFMRPTIIEEHILSHIADDLEGFAYVKYPLSTAELPDNHTGPALHPAGDSPHPSRERAAKVKYITSRQLHCHESVTMMTDALHTKEGGVRHACLIIRAPATLDPWVVVKMRSDFGTFTRKAIFNIYNEQETQFYMRATNTSATPSLCSTV